MTYTQIKDAVLAGHIPTVRLKLRDDCAYFLPKGRATIHEAAADIVRAAGGSVVFSCPNYAIVKTSDAGEVTVTRKG